MFLVIWLSVSLAGAQTPGSLEASFNPATGPNSTVNALLAQADGKLIISGPFTQVGTAARKYLARLNADGTVDSTFNSGIAYPSAPYTPWPLALQSDGKVIVIYASTFNRLNTDGSVDSTFSVSVGSPPSAVVVQSDGKVLIGGSFSSVGSKTIHNLARLTSTGALDTTFSVGGTGVNAQVNALAVQPDGKVLIGGGFTGINATARARVARLNSNGTLDTTFNPGSGADDSVRLISLQADGKLVVSGDFSHFAGVACHGMVRLNADGTVDSAFAYDGGAGGSPTTLAVQGDGKVVFGGSLYTDGGATELAAQPRRQQGPHLQRREQRAERWRRRFATRRKAARRRCLYDSKWRGTPPIGTF